MHCPRCGQQQATDSMRFCARCGFAMEGVMHLLAHGGMLPIYQAPAGEKTVSARRRGVRQGATLMLIGAVLVPLLGILAGFAPNRIGTVFEFFTASAAILCFLGGPLRMLYAALFEEGARQYFPSQPTYSPPPLPQPRVSALPPQPANQTAPWRQRPQTAEILAPPSVTDSTTQLLDKEPKTE